MAFRLDFGRMSKAERTPQGGLRVPAFVTRTGVFSYRTDDGRIVRELRHPDEVFSEDSLKTLEDCVLTDLHPGRVTSKEFKTLTIGHVRNPEQKDGFVKATVIIQDGQAVKAVEDGTRKELSCGYSCDINQTPGEYEGEKYDCIQTNIRYNHVALGPENWGRAGSKVALHLDSGDAVMECANIERDDTNSLPRQVMEFETINGIAYKVGTPEHVQALRQSRDGEKARADGAEAKIVAADAKTVAEKARADKAEGERDEFKKQVSDLSDTARFDAAVNARIELHTKAVKVLGKDFKCDGKTDREIMSAVVAKVDSNFKMDDKTSDAYLRGRFDAAVTTPAVSSVSRVKKDAEDATREQPKTEKTPSQRRDDSIRSNAERWKQPLTLSRK